MVPHVSLGAEALPAILRAGKRPFIFVNSNMDLQVLFLAESLMAPGKRALERLRPVMQMHVGIQPYLAGELLFAAGMRADEHLLAIGQLVARSGVVLFLGTAV